MVLASSRHHHAYIAAAGLAHAPLRPHLDPSDPELLAAVLDRKGGPERLHREFIFPAIKDSLTDLMDVLQGADLLVAGCLVYAAATASELSGVPLTSALLSPLMLWAPDDPPVLAPIPWLGRMRGLGPGIHGWLLQQMRRVSSGWAEPLRELRRAHGLDDGLDPFSDGLISEPLTLCMWADELASRQPSWHSSTRTSGFVFYDPRNRDGLSPQLQAFLDAGPPPVVYTLGSTATHAAHRQLDLFLEGHQLVGGRAVLTTGREHLDAYSAHASESVFITDYAPYDLLFARASLVVHHGGVGTAGKAMAAGVPMVVIPDCNDQFDNAYRCARAGVADVLPLARLRGDRLGALIKAALADTERLARCAAVGVSVASCDGATRAATLLEQRLVGGRAFSPEAA